MRTLALCLLLLPGSVCGPVFAHGASKGLHVHVAPDPAQTGEQVTFHATANATIDRLTWSCGENPPQALPSEPDKMPDAQRSWSWTIPNETSGGPLPCRFEVLTPDGKRYASLLLMIEPPNPTGQETPVPPTPQ
jgi:hypothetical protein